MVESPFSIVAAVSIATVSATLYNLAVNPKRQEA